MYLLDNPVLQRELLVNLRMTRAFVLLLGYQVLLGAVVFFAWPQETRLDLTEHATDAKAAKYLGRVVFWRTVHHRFVNGPQLCRRLDQRRKRAEDV